MTASDRAPVDLAIVGAGAAGLMTAIWAGRTRPGARIVALDGARTLGAKILVAGGGRCNVTHHEVSENDYCGSTRPAIRNVLRRFDVDRTIEFFREEGVQLKREETGKLFPTTDRARDVLDALLRAAERVRARIKHPWRVDSVVRTDDVFVLTAQDPALEPIAARRVVLAAGGRALPRSGSDGAGFRLARSLGHSITEHVFAALVPLTLAEGHPLRELAGIAADATVEVRSSTGRRLASTTGPVLCTHFGLSGPAILDISRHLTAARIKDPGASLLLNWLPGVRPEDVDRDLQALGKVSVGRYLRDRLPERLGRCLCELAGLDPASPGHSLTREARRALVAAATALTPPVTGDRGDTHAEATAGGVPLAELDIRTMGSRVCPGLSIVGELCDVDGRVGGFNFQWAWASGHIAGTSALGTSPER